MEAWLIYSVVLVSDVQQSDSVISILSIFCQIIFHYRLLQNTEHISLCYISSCWLSIFFFWPCYMAFRILVPQQGIEPVPPAVEEERPNQ